GAVVLWWKVEDKRLGSHADDHQLELAWGRNGKLARFRALENAISIRRRTPVLVDDIMRLTAARSQGADTSRSVVAWSMSPSAVNSSLPYHRGQRSKARSARSLSRSSRIFSELSPP